MRFASVENVAVTAASMELRAEFPNELKFDLDPNASSAMDELGYVLILESTASHEDVLRVVRRAQANCHAEQSLREPVPVFPALRLNGEDILTEDLGQDRSR